MAKRKHVPALVATRPAVAGIDIGSQEHWVCAPPHADGTPNVRVFRTTTQELERLAEWLLSQGVESVAMESTHVYWIPVYELLESRGLEVVLVNARQFSNVPGRKTDMKDCQWLQLLHSCGLLRGSFRPGEEICALRALQRQLDNLVRMSTKCVHWMQKALDQMNVQVHRAVTDLTGKTGMTIVRAIVAGERDPKQLAELRDRRCRKSKQKIAEYLTGTWRDEHLFNLQSALNMYDSIAKERELYEQRLLSQLKALQPPERASRTLPAHPNPKKEKALRRRGESRLRTELWRLFGVDLTQIDGISTGAAKTIATELGLRLDAFPTEKHFVSWLRLSPRTAISGGKPVKKRQNGLGSSRVAGVLRMAALSLAKADTALGAEFRRTARRKGGKVAVFALARKLAQLTYRMLRFGHQYADIGAEAYEQRFQARRLSSLKATARQLGYTLVPDQPLVAGE